MAEHAIDEAEFLNLYPVRSPNIMWFLGAGTSVSAGLPTAGTLIWEFKRTLYCNLNKVSPERFPDLAAAAFQRTVQHFFDSRGGFPPLWGDDEYPHYFESLFSDESDRRRFLDDRLRGAKPSFGHVCLAALLALNRARAVWTTNFDRLIERALEVPAVAKLGARELTTCDLSCPDKAKGAFHDECWPVLVKLHGDYQYRKLKNTKEELQAQDGTLRSLLISQCRTRGLAVVGCSGRDASVMDALRTALDGDTPYPHGLFWFVRHGTKPSAPALSLLADAKRKGVQAAWVETGGFDELMADLFLPHHGDAPDIRDLIKRQRSRREPVTVGYTSRNRWPVVRLNALEVSEFPATCTVFNADVGGAREVKEIAAGVPDRLCVGRRAEGVLAFGHRDEIEKVFRDYKPREFDRRAMRTDRLRYENSVELGMLYHAMIHGIATATGLRRSAVGKGRNLFMPDASILDDDEADRLRRLRGSPVQRLRSPQAVIHQAVGVSLTQQDGRLWLLLRPMLEVTSDGLLPYDEPDRAEIGREELVRRYNRQANDWLEFWIAFLKRRLGDPLRVSFPDAQRPDATFQVRTITTYSRRQ